MDEELFLGLDLLSAVIVASIIVVIMIIVFFIYRRMKYRIKPEQDMDGVQHVKDVE